MFCVGAIAIAAAAVPMVPMEALLEEDAIAVALIVAEMEMFTAVIVVAIESLYIAVKMDAIVVVTAIAQIVAVIAIA